MLVGFIGLGLMGQPMARNLACAGTPLVVWNRTSAKCSELESLGADVAADAREVFRRADIVILMLAGPAAIDAVVERGDSGFVTNVSGRIIVHMGTTSPAYSAALGDDVRRAGGAYVEAPVSGSRTPAEAGELIALLAGRESTLAVVQPVLRPMCREQFVCGDAPPRALLMKLAVNAYLITMVTGLCEAFHFADGHGLDTGLLRAVLDASPMASSVSRIKSRKLADGDFAAQAGAADVRYNAHLVSAAARAARVASPLLDVCTALYDDTVSRSHGHLDMIAVLRALEDLTATQTAAADEEPR